MTRLPTVTFVDELPADQVKHHSFINGWVGYVLAKLEDRPGEWAHIDADRANTHNVKQTCERAGVNVEVVTRNHDLYMRVLP